MIRTVALIALVGSASAAGIYKSDEIGCTNAYDVITCDSYNTEAACTANDACLWDSADEGCDLAADKQTEWDGDNSATALALSAARNACRAMENTVAACTGNCAVGPEECIPILTKVTLDLKADTASAGIKGYLLAETISDTTRAIHTTAAACTAVAGCEFQTMTVGDQTMSRCQSPDYAKIQSIKALCVDSGATTYTTAAAAATPSGAGIAAPLMVVLSTLVAALAIFA